MDSKTYKDGYAEGVKEALQIIRDAEKDPDDMTRLSLRVTRKLQELTGLNHGCN